MFFKAKEAICISDVAFSLRSLLCPFLQKIHQFFLHFLDTFEGYIYCRMVHDMGLSECPRDKYRSCNFDRSDTEFIA